jgi:hypothetical protein
MERVTLLMRIPHFISTTRYQKRNVSFGDNLSRTRNVSHINLDYLEP